jgi:hypothetical protein
MRYGILPQSPEEGQVFGPTSPLVSAIDLIMPMLQTRSIMAAVHLGLSEALRDGPRPATSSSPAAPANDHRASQTKERNQTFFIKIIRMNHKAERRTRLSSGRTIRQRRTAQGAAHRAMYESVKVSYV